MSIKNAKNSCFLFTILSKGGRKMPDIANGRKKICDFLKENNIKKAALAAAYGMSRQEVTNILSGSTRGLKANQFILRVIEDYKID